MKKLTDKQIAAYNESFQRWHGYIQRVVIAEGKERGEGTLTNATYQHPRCGCRVTGNGSLHFPLTVKFCKAHKAVKV